MNPLSRLSPLPYRFAPTRLIPAVLALGLALLPVAPVRAQSLLFDFAEGGAFLDEGVFGYELRFTAAFRIEGLGIWDEGADGLAASHEVGLWDQTGATLFTSALLTNADTPVVTPPAAAQGGRWLFTPVTPFVLGPGRYVVGAHYGRGNTDAIRSTIGNNTTLLPLTPDIEFIVARRLFDAPTLSFPTGADEVGGFYGPAVFGSVASAAPEPASAALLFGALPLLGLARRTRR